MFTSSSRNTSSLLMSLPNELLAEIATYVPQRHPTAEYVIEIKSLAALSTVSRKLRAITLPYLFNEAVITNERQLRALSDTPTNLLVHIHQLNIFLDVDFLLALKSMTPILNIGKILAQTPALRAFRILVAESCGPRSAWTRSSALRVDGIPIGAALKYTLPTTPLPELAIMELDAVSDIAPLLRIAPNLERLSMNLPSGFAQHVNAQFIEALRFVPNLRELAYSPHSLRVTSTLHDFEGTPVDDFEMDEKEKDVSAELLEAIGKAVPMLESLNLQTRWYGDEIVFPSSTESITPEGILEAAKHLKALKRLALPTTIANAKDCSTIRSKETSSDNVSARDAALERITLGEKSIVYQLGHIAEKLSSVSFVRPTTSAEPIDSAVVYSVQVIPEHTLYLSHNASHVTRARRVELSHPAFVHKAAFGLVEALPILETTSRFSEWCNNAAAYASEHQLPSLFLACAGGVILGEAGRALYSSAATMT